jgi:hypothetical protein
MQSGDGEIPSATSEVTATEDDPETSPIPTMTRRRRWWGVVLGIAVILVLTAAAVIPLAIGNQQQSRRRTADSNPTVLQRWWVDSHGDVEALSNVIDDVQHALAVRNPDAVGADCQRMHDAAEVTLKSRLPAPDPILTAQLAGAAEDAHDAAHMCLAAEDGSQTNYAGEFRSDLEQSQRQLRAAQALVNRLITAS